MKRCEHPNPSKKHSSFINLNGSWEFEYDNTLVGKEKKYFEREHLSDVIEVPFAPESKLSGHGNTDFINAVWYRRDIDIPETALEGNVLITFGAVDYETEVYINGALAMTHVGGYTPFTVNAAKYLKAGKNSLCVYARDDKRNNIPRGKQCSALHSRGCDYTRTTGIWQTVYMELLPKEYIKNVRLTPDPDNCSVTAEITASGFGTAIAEVFYKGKKVGECTKKVTAAKTNMEIALSEKHLWEVGHGRLYDVKLTFGEDVFESYFGLRSVALDGKKFLINNKSVFQRLVLDQGYFEDGIYTAPDKETLEKDIILSKSLGFNGARPHMKVFEPLYFYYCDIHGYLAWGEFPCWGLCFSDYKTLGITLSQWLEAVERDYNHPSVIGWCPFNESYINKTGNDRDDAYVTAHDTIIKTLYLATKAIDPIRPCIDTSGYVHQSCTDIYDIHDYKQDAALLHNDCEMLAKGELNKDEINYQRARRFLYNGQPLFVSEFGGARWSDSKENSWGYGDDPKTEKEFIDRFESLCDAIMTTDFFGFCYTQLYDIEQEQNGLLYYDRTYKFSPEKFKAILEKSAKIEK